MIFNRHLELDGKHALLSPSKPFWMGESDDAFIKRICAGYAAQIGTVLHDEARKHIEHGFKVRKYDKQNIIMALLEAGIPRVVISNFDMDLALVNFMNYVNDTIGFVMQPEVTLKYSDYCFGHTDAIMYDETERVLRVHDMKTGTSPVHMEQLLGYAGLFCLEYAVAPKSLKMCELRIYQAGDVIFDNPTVDDLTAIVNEIRHKSDLAEAFFDR